jgi:hypothetical protein
MVSGEDCDIETGRRFHQQAGAETSPDAAGRQVSRVQQRGPGRLALEQGGNLDRRLGARVARR